MGRTSSVPPGFYSAKQAIKKLGTPRSTFYDMVERGQITKVVPPNKSDGWYLKSEVDKIARANQLFMLQYATDVSTFGVANEEDIEGISDLNTELFGGNSSDTSKEARLKLRMSQYQANSKIFHVLKQGETVVGYIGIFPLKHEAIEKIMSGITEARFRLEVLAPQYIVQFIPREAEEVFLIIGAKQDVRKSRLYGARLIAGTIEFIEMLARQGVIIKKAYATSRTQDGIRISNGLGFKRITPSKENDNLIRYELDLLNSSNPLLTEYQRIAKMTES